MDESTDLAPPSSRVVLEMFRPFDPMSPEAEAQYDAIVRRLNRARARLAVNEREREDLERQFVENDLEVLSGPRRGLPLSAGGRRKRLQRLMELSIEARRLRDEEAFSNEHLCRMNEALDRWSRETYGP
jgi:hypothetical protein